MHVPGTYTYNIYIISHRYNYSPTSAINYSILNPA